MQIPEYREGNVRALTRATELLKCVLATGPKPVVNIESLAIELGISVRTLQRARSELGVISSRSGYGADGNWVLRLPE